MRLLVLPFLLWASAADADLYRWVDPASGSVKYSSVAPPWYGDGGRGGPAVEVLPSQAPPIPTQRSGDPSISGLEARWRASLQAFSALAAGNDFERAGRAIEQQLEAYQGLLAELDRRDPAGRGRRQAEEAMVLEKLRK